MKPTNLTSESFDSVVATQPLPILVDFWAEWCGPCKMLSPVLDELAAEQNGKAVVAKVNVDQAPELAARFGISAIPTLMIFKSGQPVRTLRGVHSKAALAASLAAA